MISSYDRLSFRYLKKQKKRTILNILGVLMSAALITGTGTIIESVKNQMIQSAVKSEGNFHVCFKNVDAQQAFLIRNHIAVEKSCSGKIAGFSVLAETGDDEIPYRLLRLNQNDENAMKMLQMKDRLIEGRLPLSSNEIAVEESVIKILGKDIKTDSLIRLKTGQRRKNSDNSIITSHLYPLSIDEKEEDPQEHFDYEGDRVFTITGILSEDFYMSENYSLNAVIYKDLSEPSPEDRFNMLVLLKDPASAKATAETIAAAIGLDRSEILYNHRLLNFSGNSIDDNVRTSILGFEFIVVAIIVIATIAVIYNSFNISLIERISQFGIMRCIGAAPGQIRKLMLGEAGLISLAAIPPGVFTGLIAMKLVFLIADILSRNPLFEGLQIVISPKVIFYSIIICTATVFISVLAPAFIAGKIPPMEAVRSTGMYNHDRIKKQRFIKFRGLFRRFSTVMAYRNISRNRKRFAVTLFSMVISVVLFVSFGGMLRLVGSLYLIQDNTMPGLMLESDSTVSKDILNELESFEDIDLLIKYTTTDISIIAEPEKLSSYYYDYVKDLSSFRQTEEGIHIPNCRIICYGDAALPEIEKYLESGNSSGIMLTKQGLFYNKSGRKSYFPNSSYRPGENLILNINGTCMEETISGVLRDVYYEDFNKSVGGIDIVVNESLYAKLTGAADIQTIYIRLKPDGDKDALVEYLDKIANTRIGYNYIDAQIQADENSREMQAINIFFYGFIFVIALISCLNIINTISTNLLIRSREFGIIRAVGLDKAGLKMLILKECIIYSSSALLLGSIAGTGLWYLLIKEMSNIRMSVFRIPWQEIGIAAIGLLIITITAGYFPVKRINKKTIIDNIRFEE